MKKNDRNLTSLPYSSFKFEQLQFQLNKSFQLYDIQLFVVKLKKKLSIGGNMDGGWSALVRIPFTLVPNQARAKVHEPDTDTRRWP